MTEQQDTKSEPKRANDLNGKDWTRYSLSVWRDIKRSSEERALKHPAMFPVAMIERLIVCLTRNSEKIILDPFAGSGSTLIAAKNLGRKGIGIELSPEYIGLAESRLGQGNLFHTELQCVLHQHDARHLTEVVPNDSIDFCVTSPPYWNILTRKRTADYKEIRNYGDLPNDLGRVAEFVIRQDLQMGNSLPKQLSTNHSKRCRSHCKSDECPEACSRMGCGPERN